MLELLKSNYFQAFYGVALIYSLIKYRYYFDSVLKYFPIVIGYTFLSEILGLLIRDFDGLQLIYAEGYSYYNQLIYNIFDIVFFLYFYYVFWNSVSKVHSKKLIKYGSIIFIIASATNPFLQDIMIVPQLLTIIVGSIILVLSLLLYLFEVKLGSGKKRRPNLLLWISIGLLAFYTFYPIIMAMGIVNYDFYTRFQLHKVLHVLIAIMYGCFIVGFIRMKRRLVL